jgi:multiple sugar transport system substrate-binding protein
LIRETMVPGRLTVVALLGKGIKKGVRILVIGPSLMCLGATAPGKGWIDLSDRKDMRRKSLFARWGAITLVLAALLTWPKSSMVTSCRAGEIIFLTWKASQPEVWEGLIDRFHRENPDVRVRVQVGPHSSTEYHAIVTQRLKNKDPSIDVFFMDVIWPPEFLNAGWAMDLSARFDPEERQQFLSGPIAANTYKGKICGVPCFLGAGLFYYRKDLLTKYGFEPPRTWLEMLDQGRQILEGEKDPSLSIYSGQFKQYEGLVCNMLEFIWSNGGDVLDPETGSVLLGEPQAMEAVAFVRDRIIGTAAPRGVLNYEEPESLALFVQGKAVFHRNWPYAWPILADPQKSVVAGKVGVGRLPAFEDHASASTLGGWQFGISRWSKNMDDAWRFIRFMTSFEAQKVLALEAGLAPTRRAVYTDPEVRKKMSHLVLFLPAFEKARPRPSSPLYPMMSAELQRFFSHAIVRPDSDIPELAETFIPRIDRIVRLGARIGP